MSLWVLGHCDAISHLQVLLLLQGSLLLPEPLSELGQPTVHRRHLQVPLVQGVSLLLQPAALVLVQLVPQLGGQGRSSVKTGTQEGS